MSSLHVLYAPNVHQGGGRSLLIPMLEAWQKYDNAMFVLDHRLQVPGNLHLHGVVHHVKPTLVARIFFEWRLKRLLPKDCCLLSMSNLPPLLAHQGEQHVFLQNRYLIDPSSPLRSLPIKVCFRMLIERWWLRSRARYVKSFFVQTSVMRRLFEKALSCEAGLAPIVASLQKQGVNPPLSRKYKYDFVYVASGESHKNHRTLIEAWIELARRERFPSLALTLDAQKFPVLCNWIRGQAEINNLDVTLVGECSPSEIQELYKTSKALVYPSYFESFGLPLIEAVFAGLPVLAGSADYVKDVICPTEEFDELSPKSIADAVCRCSFEKAKLITNLINASEFLENSLKE